VSNKVMTMSIGVGRKTCWAKPSHRSNGDDTPGIYRAEYRYGLGPKRTIECRRRVSEKTGVQVVPAGSGYLSHVCKVCVVAQDDRWTQSAVTPGVVEDVTRG